MNSQTSLKMKLTVEQQIVDMQNKAVKFEICSIEDAKRFLKNNNYYFKLKSYAKNYNFDERKKIYYNLDFAYLIELSKLDMYLRKIILELSLDVEHYLKVRLINDMTNNPKEDGYNIVRIFLRYHQNASDDIKRKADKYSFCSNLVENHLNEDNNIEGLALWNIVELLSFGNFIELYEVYYQTYESFNYIPYLKSVKYIRNAAAHNNCILSSIRKPNSLKRFNKTKQLATLLDREVHLKNIDNIHGMMKNPVIHDFVALLFVYNDILKVSATKDVRNKKMRTIREFICDDCGRFKKNKDYFKTNPYLVSAYNFISSIIKYIDNMNNNPKHINFIK